jgi:hypothetical protein
MSIVFEAEANSRNRANKSCRSIRDGRDDFRLCTSQAALKFLDQLLDFRANVGIRDLLLQSSKLLDCISYHLIGRVVGHPHTKKIAAGAATRKSRRRNTHTTYEVDQMT